MHSKAHYYAPIHYRIYAHDLKPTG